jgi:hypothetical protein
VDLVTLPEALRVHGGRLAPERALPLAGLLKQVLPGDLACVPAPELSEIDGLDHRLLRAEQTVIGGHTCDQRDEALRGAVGHLGHLGVAPAGHLLPTVQDDSAGTRAVE